MISRQALVTMGCLVLLYASWGTTFLANKIALEYIPGLLLSGIRFSLAGFILLAYTFIKREASSITRADIKYSLENSILLVVIGSGFVAKAQETVPSGLAAILFGAAPIWLMLGQWLLWGGKKPTLMQASGLALGFCALAWLNVHQGIQGDTSLWGLFLILFATFAWVYGSHFSQVHQKETNLSMIRGAGLLLFIGGLETLLLALLLGERVDIFSLPMEAYFPLTSLVFLSSILGYTSYLWLLFNSRAIIAISYEYVTPAIAVILGALFANENLDINALLASAVLILSVFLITTHDRA